MRTDATARVRSHQRPKGKGREVSDLADIIAQSTIRAFNAGYLAGKEEVLSAVKAVTFDYRDLEVAAISDLQEELEMRAKNATR
jgi:hypothetical protein